MDTWEQYKDKFKRISIDKMLTDIFSIVRVQDEVIRLNQEQLQAGVDVNNTVIITKTAEYERKGKRYSLNTINIKEEKGQPTDVVTLKDSGDTYDSMKVIKVSGGWKVIINYTLHGKDIRKNFDKAYDFEGLDPESLAELTIETILPRLENMINAQL